MAENNRKEPDLSSVSEKKRRRSDRHKKLTGTRTELYKDKHLTSEEIQELRATEKQRKNVARVQATLEEEWINFRSKSTPVKENKQPKEEYQDNFLNKKIEEIKPQKIVEEEPIYTLNENTLDKNNEQAEEKYLYDILNKKIEEAEKEEKFKEEKPKKKKKEETKKEESEEDTIKPLYRFLIKLGVFAAVMILMFTVVLGIHINKGDRMYPFIMDGDVLITLKITPYRDGDVVVYKSPDSGKKEISRIAAAGPNEVDIVSGIFVVNGDYTETDSLFETYWLENSPVIFPYDVSDDSYFLLDDYRPLGKDSRLFGQINKKDLKGKVIYVFRIRGI